MKLVYFSSINNSFPVLYVLNEISRGLVLACRMLNFYRIVQVTQDHSLGADLFLFSFFLLSFLRFKVKNLCSIVRCPVVHPLVITFVLAL